MGKSANATSTTTTKAAKAGVAAAKEIMKGLLHTQATARHIKPKQENGLVMRAVSAPRAMASTVTNRFANKTSERFKRCEFVGAVVGNTGFACTSYDVNPGDATVFPWLSQQAQRWDQYHLHSLKFHYITRSATSASGQVMLAPEYDPDDDPPTSELELSQLSGVIEDAIWKNVTVEFDEKAMHGNAQRKFVRSTAARGSWKNYDVGQLFVGVNATADTGTIGKLWVEYDISLFVPQNARDTVGTSMSSKDITYIPNGLSTYNVASSSPQSIMVLQAPPAGLNPLGIVVDSGGTYFDFTSPGTYKITVRTSHAFTWGATAPTGINATVELRGLRTTTVQRINYLPTPYYSSSGAHQYGLETTFLVNVSNIPTGLSSTSNTARYSVAPVINFNAGNILTGGSTYASTTTSITGLFIEAA